MPEEFIYVLGCDGYGDLKAEAVEFLEGCGGHVGVVWCDEDAKEEPEDEVVIKIGRRRSV